MLLKDYLVITKDQFYNIILIFPILLAYEALGLVVNHDSPFELRNGADVLLKNFFLSFGSYGKYFLGFFIFYLTFFIFHVGKKKIIKHNLRVSYLLLMIVEGIFFGTILFVCLSEFFYIFSIGYAKSEALPNLYLAIGAGIFEELIFRLFPLGIIYFFIIKIFPKPYFVCILLTIFSSFFFSIFHYIGFYGEPFLWSTFFIRFLGAIYLCVIFSLRGFGICVISHIIYNFNCIRVSF